MTTTIDGLTGQTTTEPDDLIVIQNVAANRTRKIRYADFIAELTADMDIITSAQLASAIAGVTSAYQAADLTNLQKVFPVGSKITLIGSGALTNPSSSLGFGTWVKEEGKFYVGHKTGDATLGTVGANIGSATHNHSGLVGGTTLNATQIPAHTHTIYFNLYKESGVGGGAVASGNPAFPEDSHSSSTSSVGNSLPHDHTISSDTNLPPSIVEVVWRRTA